MKRKPSSAGKLVVLENSDPIAAEKIQIENRIRQRAFEISQARGHAGREIEDWLSAESEIISVPPLELLEKDGTYTVQMALAGIRPDDVQVMASSDQLLVKAEFRHEHPEDAGTVHQCDFKSAAVFRTVQFPRAISLGALNIEFQDGMLRITAQHQGERKATRGAKAARPGKERKERPKR